MKEKKIVLTKKFKKNLVDVLERNLITKGIYISILKAFPYNRAELYDHELKGDMQGLRAFSLGYDLRVIYSETEDAFIFEDIGTHNEVYK